MIDITDHTKDAHTSVVDQLLDSYHHHLFLPGMVLTQVWYLTHSSLIT